MDIGTIVVIVIAAAILGVGVYFQAKGKKNIAKAIWGGLVGFLVAIGFMNKDKLKKIKKDGQDAIDDSKENDKPRTDVVESNEERIKKNEELLDEIKKALGND